ncbi:MAG: hypothetical protein KAS32_30910 [Candidatus Peribacteraceae bacterium]|nr:hypothetical protein [Candidatus Peribacteraceae bacterium]
MTKAEGVVDAVSFDLYGCIQAGVNKGLDKDKKQIDHGWYDVSRLTILDDVPVMDLPDFDFGTVAEGKKGPADKAPKY